MPARAAAPVTQVAAGSNPVLRSDSADGFSKLSSLPGMGEGQSKIQSLSAGAEREDEGLPISELLPTIVNTYTPA